MYENLVINTDRCILRALTKDDAKQLFDVLGDEEVFKLLPYDPFTSIADVEDSIVNHYRYRMIKGDACEFGILFKETGTIIGTCGFILIDGSLGVLGYTLHRDFWRKGLMTEIVGSLVESTPELLLDRVVAYCMVQNIASKNVLLNNNFIYVGDSLLNTDGKQFLMSNYIYNY